MDEPVRSIPALLEDYLRMPGKLQAALKGLSEGQLNRRLAAGGWSIRAYVMHTVDGENLLQTTLRAALGVDGTRLPFDWYFQLTQDEWAEHWAYDRRSLALAIQRYQASTESFVDMMRQLPAEVWERAGHVTWPGRSESTRLTVRNIVEINLGHLDGHIDDIRLIRAEHGI